MTPVERIASEAIRWIEAEIEAGVEELDRSTDAAAYHREIWIRLTAMCEKYRPVESRPGIHKPGDVVRLRTLTENTDV